MGQRVVRNREHRPLLVHSPRLRVRRNRQVRVHHQVPRRVQRLGGELGKRSFQEVYKFEECEPQLKNASRYWRLE